MNYKLFLLTVVGLIFANYTFSMEEDHVAKKSKLNDSNKQEIKDVKDLFSLSKLAVVKALIAGDGNFSTKLLKKISENRDTFTDIIYETLLRVVKPLFFEVFKPKSEQIVYDNHEHWGDSPFGCKMLEGRLSPDGNF